MFYCTVLEPGEWSPWSSGACSEPCGGGERTLSRTCDDPPPRNNGAECEGDAEMTEECNLMPCPGKRFQSSLCHIVISGLLQKEVCR